MASEEEVYKYILKVEGEDKVKAAAAAAALAEQKFRALFEQLGAGDARTKAAAASLVDLNKQLVAGKAANRDLGRAALEASRGFEDLQYGVAGVLNNLPGLVTALGGGAGLAGAISAVAVTGKILFDHWDEIAGLFGQGATKTEAERMEELGKKTEKTAEETAKLLKYETDRKNLADQRGPTEAQSSFTKGVNEAIRETPEKDVRAALEAIHGERVNQSLPEKIMADLKPGGLGASAPGFLGGVAGMAAGVGRRSEGESADAFNAAHNAGLDKIQARLATDPKAMEEFLKQAQEKKLLKPEAIDRLREAARTPEEKEDLKDEARLRKSEDKAARRELKEKEKKENDDKAEDDKAEEHFQRREVESKERMLKFEADGAEKAQEKAQKHLEKQATTGTGLDARGQMAMLRSMLSGGSREEMTARVTAGISGELQGRGVGKERADEMAREKAEGLYAQTFDEAHGREAKREEMKASSRIGVADFARSVEGSGMKKMETLTEQMKNSLTEVVKNTANVRTLGP